MFRTCVSLKLLLLVGSSNALIGFDRGIEILRGGGTALDAVEAVTRVVEDNPDDHTVGYGGYPNLRGEVELDASIMEGTTRQAGCAGALRGYRAAITVARAVMEKLPHVMVVGEGAAALAKEIGLEQEDLLTPEAEKVWRDGLAGDLAGDTIAGQMAAAVADLVSDPERAGATEGELSDRGTVDVLALDSHGHIASAVSTSGWAWKYPGRLGDSPVIGAGNYCDDRFGAAACTGFGELALRAGLARAVVDAMGRGLEPGEACEQALADIGLLEPPRDAALHVVALSPAGAHGAASLRDGRTYAIWSEDMNEGELRPRRHAPLV